MCDFKTELFIKIQDGDFQENEDEPSACFRYAQIKDNGYEWGKYSKNEQLLDMLVHYRPECPEVEDFAVFASYIASILKALL